MLGENYNERYDILHHSRLDAYRSPQGAAPVGSKVTLRLGVGENLAQSACMVNVECDGIERVYEMTACGKLGERELFGIELDMPEDAGLVRYYFVVNDRTQLLYYGAPQGGGKGEVYKEGPMPYQITVYEPWRTPAWLKKGVLYHIFVDRFHQSGPIDMQRVRAHRDKGRAIHLHGDWNEQVEYRPSPASGFYEPNDFFGGDLCGIIDKLDYLEGLGVTCLYLSPVFESPSNHKYDISDYKKIDPMFGTEADFERLSALAAARGIRVILDGVFSHTGSDSVYFNKEGRYDSLGAYQSMDSPYYNWYTFTKFPEDYQAWWGFKTLPEVEELRDDYLDFTLRDDDAVVKHWLRAGASGFRLDVADELPDAYIRIMREEVKSVREDAILLGEVWEDASNKFSHGEARKYVMGRELDSVMNYPFRSALIDFFLYKAHARAVRYRLESLQENYPREFFYACMNLLSSHDMPRALSLLSGAPDKDYGLSREQQANFSLAEGQLHAGAERMLLATFLQFTFPGVPSIYYGDEAGMTGLMDPFNRGTYPWGRENQEILGIFRKVSRLRRAHTALMTGSCIYLSPHDDVLGAIRFVRGGVDALGDPGPDSLFIALANRSETALRVLVDFDMLTGPDAAKVGPCAGEYRELISGDTLACKDLLHVNLEPYGAVLLQKLDP